MSLTPAPFYADVADGPDGGAAYWLTASDGVRIRIGVWGGGKGGPAKGTDKGTVLLFPGRTEYIEKYGRTAKAFADRGFSTVAVDWRGQGLADRALDNRLIGHVIEFTEYQKDIEAVLAALPELGLPDRMGMVGHSMGGCIGLRALMEGLPVCAAAFSGPMWNIALGPFRRNMGWGLAAISRHLGLEHLLAPGTGETPYPLANPFENNMLTPCPDMYDYMRQQLKSYPDLALGGPSLGWLYQALNECHTLSLRPTPDVPTLTFLGTNERIVDVPAIHDRMARWQSNGELRIIEGGEHEILLDLPDVQTKIYDAIVDLFTRS